MLDKGNIQKRNLKAMLSALIQVNPKNMPLHLSSEVAVRLKAGLSTDTAICVLNFGEIRSWPKPVLSLPTDSWPRPSLCALHSSPFRERGLISKQSVALCSFSLFIFFVCIYFCGRETLDYILLSSFSLGKKVPWKFSFECLLSLKKKKCLSFRRAKCSQIHIY